MTTSKKARVVKAKTERAEGRARWFAVRVDVFEHPALDDGPYCTRSAFLSMIASAPTQDRRLGHKGKVFTLSRGQILGGRSYWAQLWGWSEQRVRTVFARWQREGLIAFSHQSNGHYANIITICNYDKYQFNQIEDNQSSNQCSTSAQPDLYSSTPVQDYLEKDSLVLAPQPPAAAKKRATRLPEDWVLPTEWRVEFAKAYNVPENRVEEQAKLFFNYWTSKSGKDASKLNWKRTFDNWLHNARERTVSRGMNGKANGHAAAHLNGGFSVEQAAELAAGYAIAAERRKRALAEH